MSVTAKVIQYMLSHGCVTSEELFEVLTSLRPQGSSQLSVENTAKSIQNLNEKLQIFNMRIRTTYDNVTKKNYYSLINTVDNDISRKASHYSEKEFEYFRQIWRELQDGPMDVTRLYNLGKNLKVVNYKDIFREWCDKHWLRVSDDMISLGPRANAELDVLISHRNSLTQPTCSRMAGSELQSSQDES